MARSTTYCGVFERKNSLATCVAEGYEGYISPGEPEESVPFPYAVQPTPSNCPSSLLTPNPIQMVYPSCNYNENLYPFIHTPEDFDDYSDSEMSQTSAAETPSTHTLNASANPGPPNPAPRVIRYHVCYRTHLSGSDSDADSDSEMSETSDTEVAGTHTSSTSANRQDDTTIEGRSGLQLAILYLTCGF